jgi:integral membrane sensor domain MASE1
MREVVAAIVLVCGIAWLGSAVVLIGAVLSLGRPDHRNPVAYRWIAWHVGHSFRSIHL